jgi:hypothetical protein
MLHAFLLGQTLPKEITFTWFLLDWDRGLGPKGKAILIKVTTNLIEYYFILVTNESLMRKLATRGNTSHTAP